MIGTAVGAVILAASAALPAGARVLTWGLTGLAYLAGFALVLVTASPIEAAALTMTDALIERFGLLIIIVLGETVTGVVAGFGALWTYVDFAGHRPPRPERSPAWSGCSPICR